MLLVLPDAITPPDALLAPLSAMQLIQTSSRAACTPTLLQVPSSDVLLAPKMLIALFAATDCDDNINVICAALTAIICAAGAAEEQNVVRNPRKEEAEVWK